MLLTDDNYYSREANWQYMSVSQYKKFIECEARAVAELNGVWKDDIPKKALLVGNYVHSYFESEQAHQEFLAKNGSELYKKNGGLYKDFEVANKMIERVEREPFFNTIWQGDPELIVTGELYGVEWKGKIDLLNIDEGYFVDLKTTQTFNKRFWSNKYGGYIGFVEAYGYFIQMGIYEQLLEQQYGKPFKGFIYAVTKENEPDLAAINPAERKIEFEMDLVEESIDRVEKVKTGQVEPDYCGICDYCKQNKELTGFVSTDDLLDMYN